MNSQFWLLNSFKVCCSPYLIAQDLAASLAGIVVRRRLDEGEFAYVLLASGHQISGKKAAFKQLKTDEAVFQALKEDYKEEGESDLAFDSRCLKLLNSVPFEDEQDTGAVLAAAEAAMSSSNPSKSKDWDGATKAQLGKLVAKRRLEGGEFTYVYLPLDKPIQGKQAMFSFLKNQGSEYSAMVKACKNPAESDDAFVSRLKQAILVVPYEKDVEMVDATVAGKRRTDSPASGSKKAKTDQNKVAEPENRMVFLEVELLSSQEQPSQILQIGAVSAGGARFLQPLVPSKKMKSNPEILAGLGFKLDNVSWVFRRGNRMKTPVQCSHLQKGLENFIAFLKEVKGSAKTLTLIGYRRESFGALLCSLKATNLTQALGNVATNMSSLEEVFQQRQMHTFLPTIPLVLNYINLALQKRKIENPHKVPPSEVKRRISDSRLAGLLTADDLAQRLAEVVPKLQAKYNIPLATVCKASNFYIGQATPMKPFPGMSGAFTVINSSTFTKKEFFSFGDDWSEVCQFLTAVTVTNAVV